MILQEGQSRGQVGERIGEGSGDQKKGTYIDMVWAHKGIGRGKCVTESRRS